MKTTPITASTTAFFAVRESPTELWDEEDEDAVEGKGEDAAGTVAVEEGLLEESDDVGIADIECALDEGPEELVGVPLARKQSGSECIDCICERSVWVTVPVSNISPLDCSEYEDCRYDTLLLVAHRKLAEALASLGHL